MPTAVRALRGATTAERDEPNHINERVQELVTALLESNEVSNDDIISVMFTATADISSCYPATAARALGLADVPLLGAQELTVDGMLPMCVRVLVHLNTSKTRGELVHIYLHEARRLRVDLVK